MKRLIILFISYLLLACNSTDDQTHQSDTPVHSIEEIVESNPNEILIDGSNINCNEIDSLDVLDSLQHIKLAHSFPILKLNTYYDRYSPLANYGSIVINSKFNSRLILDCNESWGITLYLLNYDKQDNPINGIQLVSCGGDGGFGECSKATIFNDTCTIEYKIVESSEDMETQYETKMIKQYTISDSLNFNLIHTESHTDTIK
jgi:hypothetical protein